MLVTRFIVSPYAALALGLMLAGCGKTDPTGGDKPTGNPITDAKGPIGQGGDPAAMAVRRGAPQAKAVNDMKQLATYYNLYRTEAGAPNTMGFLKYLDDQARDAAALVKAVKDGAYVVRVPKDPSATGMLAWEKDADYQGTRVVVMTDGSVTKTFSQADFQKAQKSE